MSPGDTSTGKNQLSDAVEQLEQDHAPVCGDCGTGMSLRGLQQPGTGDRWLLQWICPTCEPDRVKLTRGLPDGYEVVHTGPEHPEQQTLTQVVTDGGTSAGGNGRGDYLDGLPHEVVNEFDVGRGLSMRRVALDAEDAYTVDIVLAERHLRLMVETDGTEASELTWDGRMTFHDPDAVETFAEELLHAAEWMREEGGDDEQ